jgi:hypothetical protein
VSAQNCACSTHVREKNTHTILTGQSEERNDLEDRGADKEIILK